jgi:hypothetical protein
MASVTYNGQSFSVDGRRFWILGASIQYARVPVELWRDRIAAARQAGFNTIETACPWFLHEPRKGRFGFQGEADLRKFIQLCATAGMRVILRVGPYIGSQFDAGGLPGWLIETPGVKLRQADEIFLEHVSRYLRKLLGEIADLQATQGGPILLIQSEHAWECTNDEQDAKYLSEITRFIRENGITIPITNANDLWQQSPETIDTWRGWGDLLIHLRQLRTVQPNAPRLVSAFDCATTDTWGAKQPRGKVDHHTAPSPGKSPEATLNHLAEILAAAAQPVLSPFHGGTNFGFMAGRVAGGMDGFVTTCAAHDAPLAEAGTRGEKYQAIRRLITFASSFGHVFADLDPDYHPIILDPSQVVSSQPNGREGRSTPQGGVAVVPVRGSQGSIVFVFAGPAARETSLLLDDGVRIPVLLGDQSAGWFALNVDLQGSGRLDYANLCPWAIVDRSVLVLQGPERAGAYLSISGTPLEATVPAASANGGKPLVLDHKGITIVLCNQSQIDATYHDEKAIYVGISGFDAQGKPIPAPGWAKSWVIRKGASIEELKFAAEEVKDRRTPSKQSGSIAVGEWQFASAAAYATGESPRFASLEGPETLANCGAPMGYGWYRVTFTASSARRVMCHLPHSGDRLHLFAEGKPVGLIGVGPAADPSPFELRVSKGSQTLIALADNLGRFSDGNDLGMRKGWFGHLYEVKALRTAKPKIAEAQPVDPFVLRGFIAGRGAGQMSDTRQAIWSFAHTKKSPLIIDVVNAPVSGTFILNDQPLEYFAGITGGCMDRILLDPAELKCFKRGQNTLRFAPDVRQEHSLDSIVDALAIYECLDSLTENATWSFAKWEPPAPSSFVPVQKGTKAAKGVPCWWRSTFKLQQEATRDVSFWLDTNGLSKGQAYINGHNLGRYFTATGTGKAVGPQNRLYVPGVWLRPASSEANEVMLFDEHGFEPSRVRIGRE